MTGAVQLIPAPRTRTSAGPYPATTVLAVLGALLLAAGTVLHPAGADPNDPVAAFTEYAGPGRAAWVTAHLLQLAGITGLTLAIILLAGALAGPSTAWVRTTQALGTASLALVATLQAVDGVALKAVVDRWSAAAAPDRPPWFAAALAVRQVEIGLDGLWALALGAAALGFAGILLTAARGSTSLGILALVAAVLSLSGGLLFCLQGFSPAAMNVSMAGGALGFLAVICVAVRGWRLHGTT